MRNINLWAYHGDFGLLCRHAATDGANGLSYPQGTAAGQAGWHVAVKFTSLGQLADTLSDGVPMPPQFCDRWFRDCDPVRRGEIARLAIMAHGDMRGRIYVNGEAKPHLALTPDNVVANHNDLHRIGLLTRQDSTILLMGCLAGQSLEGTRLLVALSQVWPGRRVVGFSTIGYRHPGEMKRGGEPCEFPGMRDTDAYNALMAYPPKFDKLWRDFATMPWASESSRHAKVVRDGKVERCPPEERCAQ